MKLVSGDICPKTGMYQVVKEDGSKLNSVFVGRGETMPPTACDSCYFELVD